MLLGDSADAGVAIFARGGERLDVRRQAAATPSGGRLIATVPVEGSGTLSRLVHWLRAVDRARRIERQAVKAGLMLEARLGTVPSLEEPRIMFDTRGHAGRYACEHLLVEPIGGGVAALRSVLRAWTGIPTSVGGIIVIARRP
jgi:hypothetical protein